MFELFCSDYPQAAWYHPELHHMFEFHRRLSASRSNLGMVGKVVSQLPHFVAEALLFGRLFVTSWKWKLWSWLHNVGVNERSTLFGFKSIDLLVGSVRLFGLVQGMKGILDQRIESNRLAVGRREQSIKVRNIWPMKFKNSDNQMTNTSHNMATLAFQTMTFPRLKHHSPTKLLTTTSWAT